MTINFVLVPTLGRLQAEERRRYMAAVFPRVFRLASVLALLAGGAGLPLAIAISDGQWSLFTQGRWGRSILVGGILGAMLTLFLLFLERRLSRMLVPATGDATYEDVDLVYRRLQVIPRIGLGVIMTIAVLMMYAARGV